MTRPAIYFKLHVALKREAVEEFSARNLSRFLPTNQGKFMQLIF